MVRGQEIFYPIFFERSPLAHDDYWAGIFENLAFGKAPTGAYISKGFLACRIPGKEFRYKIEHANPQLVFKDVYKLLSKKLGLVSKKQHQRKRENFYAQQSTPSSVKDWKDIRKKTVKDNLCENYVIDMKTRYNLTVKQARYLLHTLTISIMFKTITAEDITYSEGRITEIKGIRFENGQIIVDRPLHPPVSSRLRKEKTVDKNMSSNWKKFLTNLRKTTTL